LKPNTDLEKVGLYIYPPHSLQSLSLNISHHISTHLYLSLTTPHHTSVLPLPFNMTPLKTINKHKIEAKYRFRKGGVVYNRDFDRERKESPRTSVKR